MPDELRQFAEKRRAPLPGWPWSSVAFWCCSSSVFPRAPGDREPVYDCNPGSAQQRAMLRWQDRQGPSGHGPVTRVMLELEDCRG